MLKVSKSAIVGFKKLIANGKEGSAIRVVSSVGCCGPSFNLGLTDKGEEGDIVLEKDGLKIFIDPLASESLSEATINYLDEEKRKGFAIEGLAKSGCC